VTDVQDEIREMLRHKAGDVPAHLDVPRSLTGRVGPRIARNALAVTAAVAVVIAVGFAGFRAFNGPPETAPLGPNSSPSPSAQGPLMCASPDVVATAALEGAAGSREGSIELRNASGATCTLTGDPTVSMLHANGQAIGNVTLDTTLPAWKINGTSAPDGWPTVRLAPGESASFRLRWSNWCDPDVTPVLLISSGVIEVARVSFDAATVPPCNSPGTPSTPSTIEVGPFEPAGS
jgi:hypothetical protein